jgi:hypothetical protein
LCCVVICSGETKLEGFKGNKRGEGGARNTTRRKRERKQVDELNVYYDFL